MKKVNLSGDPVMDLVIYRIRAMDEEHWLEAIVLTHMFIETQLRNALQKEAVRKEPDKRGIETVSKLAQLAVSKKIIDVKLHENIKVFNRNRNDAVHNLASGIITYDQLEPIAKQSDELISELQNLSVHVELGPEQKIGD